MRNHEELICCNLGLQSYAYLMVEIIFWLWYIKHKEGHLLVADAPHDYR